MRNKSFIAVLASLAVFQGAAFAEVISGTITNIDPSSGRVTLRRSGDGDSLDVTIRDRASLASLRSGSAISLDANRAVSGSWEASTIETAGSSQGTSGISTLSDDRQRVGMSPTASSANSSLSDSGSANASASNSASAGIGSASGNSASGSGSTGSL